MLSLVHIGEPHENSQMFELTSTYGLVTCKLLSELLSVMEIGFANTKIGTLLVSAEFYNYGICEEGLHSVRGCDFLSPRGSNVVEWLSVVFETGF